MTRITFTAEKHHEEAIEVVREEIDADSTAAAVRECIERASLLQQREADLQQRIEDLERENERLRNEKRVILDQREEHTDLVHYVKDEMSYRKAGLGTRVKWWIFGKKDD